ncbi:MAG TPA: hypothetical protein VMS16_15755 [Mycobacterium sp.]|nr:hypothetical protein [Mycobacterium sp.]
MDAIVDRFVAALGDLHSTRDVGPLVELFADDATLRKLGMPHEERGRRARAASGVNTATSSAASAHLSDTSQVVTGIAFLDWTSEGTLSNGADFRYAGVSVLEARVESIDSFRTYYDTAAFLGPHL